MKTKILIALCTLSTLFAACSDEFLEADSTEFMEQNRKEELLKNPRHKAEIIEAELNSLYSLMIQYSLNGNSSHDYFGLKSIFLATDMTGEDMVQVRHHWFGFDYNIDNRSAPYRRTSMIWALFYKMISTSNDILEKYLSEENLSESLIPSKAQTLAVRGIAYYYLVNLYQQTYSGNEDKPGVPIVLSSADAQKPRAAVKEVYEQIIKDLTFAVEKGVYTAENKKDADQKVAAAYLAKAYASMEKWDMVEKYATIAIENMSFALPDNFFRITNADILWGYDINAQTSTIYASFFSHIDNTIGGYAGGLGIVKSIHNKLFEKMYEKDSRRKWFIEDKENQWNLPKYANIKYNSLIDFSGDYIYLRTADPYLLLVEALAEQKKTAEATQKLIEFLAGRGIPASEINSAESNLIDYIRLQRRIELWGEGTSFIDFKRWKLPIKRNVEGTNHRTKKDVSVGGVEFTYQIPQREIEQNPSLVQND